MAWRAAGQIDDLGQFRQVGLGVIGNLGAGLGTTQGSRQGDEQHRAQRILRRMVARIVDLREDRQKGLHRVLSRPGKPLRIPYLSSRKTTFSYVRFPYGAGRLRRLSATTVQAWARVARAPDQ